MARTKIRMLGVIVVAIMAMTPTSSIAQEAASGCSGPEYHQFDFWIGDWKVTSNDKPAGRNHIRRIVNRCAIHESWSSVGSSYLGQSVSFYDRTTKQWHQTWIDSEGTPGFGNGESTGPGQMILRGHGVKPRSGKPTITRTSWTLRRDGSVRQLWEASTDDGKSWSTVFEGVYHRDP